MARQNSSKNADWDGGADDGHGGGPSFEDPGGVDPRDPNATTGRMIVTLRDDAQDQGVQTLMEAAGSHKVVDSRDFRESAVDASKVADDEFIVLRDIGVVITSADVAGTNIMGLAESEASPVLDVEEERYVYALAAQAIGFVETPPLQVPATQRMLGPGVREAPLAPPPDRVYLQGYSDAVADLSRRLGGGGTAAPAADGIAEEIAAAFADTLRHTWGLDATGVIRSRATGRGIRVAVLDTGFDFNHPDFRGRQIARASFIPGQTPQDGHNHGTHCAGTACGPLVPARPPTTRRYGCAYSADLFIGKVLSNSGGGTDGSLLSGMNWAVANRCAVVSMSLGRRVRVGEAPSTAYETVARRGLDRGTLIIAAAGNDSGRPGRVEPVSSPANCPSVMAVGALDQGLNMAPFSNGGINPAGGGVDIAAPGVAVFSSVRMPTRYAIFSGTSMATPHVAGIAAMYAETSPALRGRRLWHALVSRARRLPLPARDVGAGLVQAP